MNKFKSLILLIAITVSFPLAAKSQISVKASQEKYFENAEQKGLLPSKNGIYPVQLTVTVDSNDKTLYVKVYRAEKQNGAFKLVIDTMLGNEEYFDLYDSTPMEVGQKYYYVAVLGKSDINNAPAEQKSNIACGWGALTHEIFYVYFNSQMLKSYEKMTLMNKPKAISKIGREETTGNVSGQFLYEAKVKGMGGVATMTYKNYSDDGINYYNGDMITYADMFATGTMDGFITATGMYNGTIYFSDISVKESKVHAGTYGIHPKNSTRKNIPYTWNFEQLK